MVSQLSLLDNDAAHQPSNHITVRHLNHGVAGCSGLQELEVVPGLKFVEEFLT